MSKVFYVIISACMLFFVSGCVSAYNGTLTSTVHKRSDYVNGRDVRYYRDLDPYRPVAPNVHNNNYRPSPNNRPAYSGYNAHPAPAPGSNYGNYNNNVNVRTCTRDADCPGNQRCQNINRSTYKGTCR